MKLIDNWRQAHKMRSVQIAGLAGTLIALGPDIIAAWQTIPDDLKALLPAGVSRWTAVGVLALVVLARLQHQGLDDKKDDQKK